MKAVTAAVLAEQHDEWIQQKRYMALTSLIQTKETIAAGAIDEEPTDTEETSRMINTNGNPRFDPNDKHKN